MAQHRVPQDVETADKLIGFLSLKQFLFVIGGFALSFIAYVFAKVSIFLIIPFIPFVIAFFVLGLYQRPDQPVEVYLASWINFLRSPKIRIWNQEGYEEHVVVTVPKKKLIDYSKGLSASDAQQRLRDITLKLDTRGWSTKGVMDTEGQGLISGEVKGERLVDLETIEERQKQIEQSKLGLQDQEGIDIFDANNSAPAARTELAVDKSILSNQQEAFSLAGQPGTAGLQQQNSEPVQDGIGLGQNNSPVLNNLAVQGDMPISSVAGQASQILGKSDTGIVDLNKGSEFSLR